MKRVEIKSGEIFGRLTVIAKTTERGKQGYFLYLCKCSCGNTKMAPSYLLRSGQVKSCGCLRKDKPNRFIHGMSYTREFRIWAEMIKRCSCKTYKSFSYYGGRGITVCQRWKEFKNFFADMGKCPPNFSLDRINVNGNYEPSNCRWASWKTQARNRRGNHMITYKGETLCLTEWAEKVGISRGCLKQRLKRGWALDEALKGERS